MTLRTQLNIASVSLFFLSLLVFFSAQSDYQFEKNYQFAWNLADKSSTLEAKAHYISQFVDLLESNKTDFAENDAIFFKTRDNSFEYNLLALKTLDARLREIMLMDAKSFEYQTAIQQITQQEQGEAGKLIDTIRGCWVLHNKPTVWGWVFNFCLIFTLYVLALSLVSTIAIIFDPCR